jgi:hypothetical protein
MFETATNARAFNELMNKFAGTQGVVYAHQFGMHMQNGAEYMTEQYDSVGREYAAQLLDGHAKCTGGCMSHVTNHADLSDTQRAYLSYMIDTTDKTTFKTAMQACLHRGAIPAVAEMVFSPHRQVVAAFKPAVYSDVAPAVAPAVVPAAAPPPMAVAPPRPAVAPPRTAVLTPANPRQVEHARARLASTAAMVISPPTSPVVHLNGGSQNGRSKRAKK